MSSTPIGDGHRFSEKIMLPPKVAGVINTAARHGVYSRFRRI